MLFFTHPWNHWIGHNIVSTNDLTKLIGYGQQKAQTLTWGLFYQDQVPADISDIMDRYLNSIVKISESLHQKFPAPRHQPGLHPVCHFAVQPAGYYYPPHCDHPDKAWSFVTYLWPEHHQGTHLMRDESRSEKKEIEWRQGRTLIFAGEDEHTWHDYHSGDSPRVTLCGFMVTGDDPTR